MSLSAPLSVGLDRLQRLGVTLFVTSKINRNYEHSELGLHNFFFTLMYVQL